MQKIAQLVRDVKDAVPYAEFTRFATVIAIVKIQNELTRNARPYANV